MTSNTIYRIAKWNETYETAESRRHSSLRWVSMPITLSSSGYESMLDDFESHQAPAIYGAWCALVAVAATCPIRGLLCNSRGKPLKLSHIARKTGFPSSVFEDLFRWAASEEIGWLEMIDIEQALAMLEVSSDLTTDVSGSCVNPGHRPGVAQADTGLQYPTLHNPTIHNQQQQLGADAELELLRSLNWPKVCEDAATIKRQVNPLSAQPDYIWEVCSVAEAIMYPGFMQDVAKGYLDRSIRKPRNYIEGALRRECEKQGWNLATLRAKVPPRTSEKPSHQEPAA